MIQVKRIGNEIQLDLPLARGMKFSLGDMVKLRDEINSALSDADIPTKIPRDALQQALDHGEKTGKDAFSKKIHSIQHLRSLLGINLADAKEAIERGLERIEPSSLPEVSVSTELLVEVQDILAQAADDYDLMGITKKAEASEKLAEAVGDLLRGL